MSKVPVDRELLEYLADLGDEAIERMGSYLAEKHGEQRYVDAARAVLAKPAEAEGVELQLRKVIDELKAGFVVCQQCGDQEDAATLDCVPELEAIAAALSAVTAERDALREDRDSQQRVCIASMEKVSQLRAEVEGMRKAFMRMRNVAAGYSNCCEFDSANTRRLEREFEAADELFRSSAAMAAKEA